MRIKRVPTRKILSATDQVASFVKYLSHEANESDIIAALEPLCLASYEPGGDCWRFGRSDLFHWVSLLDRFDDLLAGIKVALWESLQPMDHPQDQRPADSRAIQTTPFDSEQKRLVLVILRFSRLLLENCSSRNIYASYDRLRPLLTTLDLDVLESTLELLILPARKIESQSSLRSTFDRNIGEAVLAALAGLPTTVGKDCKLAGFFKERQQVWTAEGSPDQLRRTRFLSLALYIFAATETHLDSQNVFASDPTIITDTARQLSARPVGAVQQRYEACAITLLRSSLRIGSKWAELVYALNLGAGHASVASIVRTLCGSLASNPSDQVPVVAPFSAYYCSALLDFIQGLAGCHETDEALVASGIVEPILRGLDGVIDRRNYRVAERLLAAVDTINGHLGEAVDAFFAADGHSVIVRLVGRVVEGISKDSSFDPADLALLTGTLKILDRLVASAGVDDRLRNLVEGSLFASLRSIFQHQDVFGTEPLSLAVNLLSNFIHNEPTSLSILQEQGVTQAFCDSISLHLPPSGDLLIKLPHAFSAVCLNSAGSDYLQQSNPLRSLVSIFLDAAEYGKCLRSHNVSALLGSGMDELMRHHPQLRPLVKSTVLAMLDAFPQHMNSMRATSPSAWNGLVGEVSEESQPKTDTPTANNPVSSMFDSLCTFLEGSLQQANIMEEFVADGLIEKLFEIYLTPGLPFDFALSSESFSVAHLFRLLFETQSEKLLTLLIRHLTRLGTEDLGEFVERSDWTGPPAFLDAVLGSGPLQNANRTLDALVSILCLLRLLCDLCVSSHYSYGVETYMWSLIGGLISEQGRAGMVLMGLLFRVSTWEQYMLLESVPPELAVAGLTAAQQISRRQTNLGLNIQRAADDAEEDRAFEAKHLAPYKAAIAGEPKVSEWQSRNLTAVLYVLQKIPICLLTIYGSLARMISNRQGTNDTNKTVMLDTANILANCAMHTLEWLAKNAKQMIGTSQILNRTITSTFASAILLAGVILFNEPNFGNTGNGGFVRMSVQILPMIPFAELGGLEHFKTVLIDCFLETSIVEMAHEQPTGFCHWWREAVESGLLLIARLTNGQCYKVSSFNDLALSPSPSSLVRYIDAAGWIVLGFLGSLDSEKVAKALGPAILRIFLSLVANILPGEVENKAAERDFGMMIRNLFSVASFPNSLSTTIRERDVRFGDSRFSPANSSNYPNVIQAQHSLIRNFPAILGPLLKFFDCDLTYDVAVILSRLISGSDFDMMDVVLDWLYNIELEDWLAYQLMAILANSHLKKHFLMAVLPGLERVVEHAEGHPESEAAMSAMLTLSFALPLMPFEFFIMDRRGSEFFEINDGLVTRTAKFCLEDLLHIKEEDEPDYCHATLMLASPCSSRKIKLFCEADVLEPLVDQLVMFCLVSLGSEDIRHGSIVSLSVMLMRRLVETPDLLEALMEHEALIKYRSLNTSERPLHLDEFLNAGLEGAALRDIDCFSRMYSRVFAIRPESKGYYRSTERIVLRQQVKDIFREKGVTYEDHYPDVPPLKERLRTYGNAEAAKKVINRLIDTFLGPDTSIYPATESPEALRASEKDLAAVRAHYKRCVILMFLNELITAYPICQSAFEQSTRFTEFMTCLFSRVVPCGQLGPLGNNSSAPSGTDKMAIFVNGPLWVDFFVCNFCVGSQLASLEESVTGLKERCAFVVDGLTAALREAEPVQQSPYQKLSRMWCLNMTIYSLLNNSSSLRNGGNGNARMSSSLQLVMGARMLERGYIELLAGQLRELDAYVGHEGLDVAVVFGKIVVNLETLARLANRISSSAAKNATATGQAATASTISVLPDAGTSSTGLAAVPIQEENFNLSSDERESVIENLMRPNTDVSAEDDDDEDMEPFGYGNEHEEISDDHDESMGMIVDEDGEIIMDDSGALSASGGMEGNAGSEMMSTSDAESLASRNDEEMDEDDSDDDDEDDDEDDFDSDDDEVIDDEIDIEGISDYTTESDATDSSPNRRRSRTQIVIRPPEHSVDGGGAAVTFDVTPDMLSLVAGTAEEMASAAAVGGSITRRFLPRGSSNLPFDITIEEYEDENASDFDDGHPNNDEDEDEGFDDDDEDDDDDFDEDGNTDFDDFEDENDEEDDRYFAFNNPGNGHTHFDADDHQHIPIRIRNPAGGRQNAIFGFGRRRGAHSIMHNGARRLASPIHQIFQSLMQQRTAIPRSQRSTMRGNGRYATLFDASFAGQVARSSSLGTAAELYQHPFLQRRLGEPASGSLRSVDLSVLSRTDDHSKTYMVLPEPDENDPISVQFQNDQQFKHPVTVPTLRRWLQEARLYFSDAFSDFLEYAEQDIREGMKDDVEMHERLLYGEHPDLKSFKESKAKAEKLKADAANSASSVESSTAPEVKLDQPGGVTIEEVSPEIITEQLNSTISHTPAVSVEEVTSASETAVDQPDSTMPIAPALAVEETAAPILTTTQIEIAQPSEPIVFEDPGPDPSFLEALPFDMRPEVLTQYFIERRRALLPNTTSIVINPDFLARLPQDLRDDYQRMSQADFERWQRRRRSHGSAVAGFEQFLGSLDPAIRQMIIQSADLDAFDQDDDEMDEDDGDGDPQQNINIPPNNREFVSVFERDTDQRRLAEGIGYIEGLVNQIGSAFQRITQTNNNPAPTTNGNDQSRLLLRRGSQVMSDLTQLASAGVINPASQVSKDVAPLIGVSTLAHLLGYYFVPFGGSDKRLLNKLFQHICMNEARRADLLNMLILLLEQGPSDSDAVRHLLAEYANGGGNASSSSKVSMEKSLSPSMSSLRGEAEKSNQTTVVILQWTLQLMLTLVSHNDQLRRYFTKRSDSPWTISRRLVEGKSRNSAGCSKGKRTTFEIHYPLVVLLASLENPSISHNGMLTEHLVHLISQASQPIKEMIEGRGKDDLKDSLEIPVYFLHVLVKSLTSCELTPKAFSYMSQIFQHLSLLDETAGQLLQELSEHPTRILELLGRDLKALSSAAMEVKSSNDLEAKEKLITAGKTLSAPLSSQMRLLRLVKMMASIMFTKGSNQQEGQLEIVLKGSISNWDHVGLGLSKDAWAVLRHDLGECLHTLGDGGEADDAVHIAIGLLPAIESYFLYQRQVAAVLPERAQETDEATIAFSETHRRILNTTITSNHGLLTGSFAFLVSRIPRILDFDNKRYWFNQQLHKRSAASQSSSNFRTLSLNVRRAYVFEDSFHQIMSRSGEEIKNGKISVRFHGEQGVDAGGVTREWFEVLARRMFNPDYALFKASAADKITYQPNRASWINPDHLQFFCFVGRIIGKAIFDGRLLDCYFTRAFYKHILGIPVDMKDLETIDPDFYKSLLWILENDITGVLDHLTFSIDTEEFGQQCIVDLKLNGREIAVTEADKREYVQLVTQYRLTEAIRPQLDAFMRGFHEIIPDRLIALFDEHELELLISGLPDIDIEDWRANTDYHGYTVQSPVIQWFWRAVRSFDAEQRAKLLQFVTGTSKVPLEGFAHLQGSTGVHKFTIHRDYRDSSRRLPSAHTCFNQLDLPEYDSYEALRDMLLKVMNEAATGFGFA